MILRQGTTLRGPAGEAVEIIREGEPPRPDWQATVAVWILTCPHQSPAWDHYLLSVIHLRPIDGVRPAVIRVPQSTHEVMVAALDPQGDPRPDDFTSWHILTPLNVEEQVQLPSDEAAVEVALLSAQAVVDGVLPAEPALAGQVEPWRTALIRTAAHLRGEPHAD